MLGPGEKRDLIGDDKAGFYDRFAATHDDDAIYWAQEPTVAWYIVSRRHRALLNCLAAQLPSGGTILDVGCGDGKYLSDLPSHLQRHGSDISEIHVQRARARVPEADVRTSDGARLPFDDASVDCAYSTEVIEHVDDPDLFVREMARVAKLGGRLVITTPSRFGLFPGSLIWRWNTPARVNRALDRFAYLIAVTLRRPRETFGKLLRRAHRGGEPPSDSETQDFSHHHLWIFSASQICRLLESNGCRVLSKRCVGLNLPLMPLWVLLIFHVPPVRWAYRALDCGVEHCPGLRWLNHTMIIVAERIERP
jgi:SAM-dependent methyltransferase